MDNSSQWFKALGAVALVAIIIVVWVDRSNAAEQESWASFAKAKREASTDSLEDVRADAKGSDLEPWVGLELALQLFEKGDLESVKRAGQVASETLAGHGDHQLADALTRVRDAASSFDG